MNSLTTVARATLGTLAVFAALTAAGAAQAAAGPRRATHPRANGPSPRTAPAAVAATPATAPVVYPLDLAYGGGPVMQKAVSRPIFLTDGPSCSSEDCYGNPREFLEHLGRSSTIHVLDQYVGAAAFKVAPSIGLALPANLRTMPGGTNRVIFDAEVRALAAQVASSLDEYDYENVYQVFLPPGVDYCLDDTFSTCFSPDVPKAWTYCWNEASVSVAQADGSKHTMLYTVNPHLGFTVPQGGPDFCRVAPGTVNGQLVDSAANSALATLVTSLTNPGDPTAAAGQGTGWRVDWFGYSDPGQICLWYDLVQNGTIDTHLATTNIDVAGKAYDLSRLYSNARHSCVTGTHDDDGTSNAASASFDRYYRHPSDLYTYGGPVVARGVSRPVFLTDASSGCVDKSCYGDPQTFLDHLGRSRFIHVLDQYLPGRPDPDDVRYTVVDPVLLPLPSGLPILPGGTNRVMIDADLQRLLAGVVAANGASGDGNIYHVFLPPNVDLCFDATYSVCYSPDNYASYVFGAYHEQFALGGSGPPVLYTAEPNNVAADFQFVALSHELFETITDPNWNTTPGWNLPFFGAGTEIGDDCEYLAPVTVDLAGASYLVQREYSNRAHGCVNAP